MTVLIDSDWMADYLKGRLEAVQFLTDLTLGYAAISIITFGEIYEGIYYGSNPEHVEHGFNAFLNEVVVLPLETEIMKRFARIRGGLRRSGQLISDTDLLIAVTALHHDLSLVTRNRRHFERIPDLRILSGPP